jgi:phosphoribosylformylglycinamidine synthase
MYDGEVKGLSVVKPFVGCRSDVPSDATVMRVEHGAPEGLILAEGINPFYADLDAYHMMAGVVDEGVRRIISAGGRLDRIAGLDNFCWPDPVASAANPDGPHKLAQLVRANQALYDVTTAYGVPCISGKDSMKNDSVRGRRRISIPPTVLFSTLGKIDDVRRAVTMPYKREGDAIYVVGWTRAELGASEYHRWLAARQGNPGHAGGEVPRLDTGEAAAIYQAMTQATSDGLVRSSHTPSLGGLAVALALCSIGGDLGAEIDLKPVPRRAPLRDDEILFSESNARFLITCSPQQTARLEARLEGLPAARVGRVCREPRVRVLGQRGRELVNQPIRTLRRAFRETLDGL